MTESTAKNTSPSSHKRSSQSDSHSSKTVSSTLMFSEHFRVSMMVGMITVGMIALFSGSGYLLDLQLGTKPFFLLAGVILSFPLSQFVVYRWIKRHYVPRMTSKQ